MADDFQAQPPRATPPADADLGPIDRYGAVSFRKPDAQHSRARFIRWACLGAVVIVAALLFVATALVVYGPSEQLDDTPRLKQLDP
jgi:hypothetical protein